MPAAIPLLIGGVAGLGASLVAKKLAPKPKPIAPPVEAAPVTAPIPPETAQLNSDSQAAAIQAGLKRRRTAMSGGILGPKPGALASVSAMVKPKGLIGSNY